MVETETLQATSLRLIFVILAVAPSPIPNGKAESQHHDAERRRQHYKDGAVKRALRFSGRGLRIGITHGAPLREGGSHPRRKNPSQQNPTILRKQIHRNADLTPYCKPTPFGGGSTRPASGKKKKYIMMKQAVTEITSIQRINAFSNFKCMKYPMISADLIIDIISSTSSI